MTPPRAMCFAVGVLLGVAVGHWPQLAQAAAGWLVLLIAAGTVVASLLWQMRADRRRAARDFARQYGRYPTPPADWY